MKNEYRRLIYALLFFVFVLSSCGSNTEAEVLMLDTSPEESEDIGRPESTMAQDVCVYVCGRVVNPGVYILKEGERVCDAVALAGGMTADAALDYWNLAMRVEDGMKIYIPSVEEAADMPSDSAVNTSSSDGKTNINTADKEALMKLPGIGETRAERILLYRQEHGRFSDISELMQVSGIKESIYRELEEYVTVNEGGGELGYVEESFGR